jgi:hypothetical protein
MRYNVICFLGFLLPLSTYKICKTLINSSSSGIGSIKNLLVGFTGFILADNIIGLRFVYDHTYYVRDRLEYENKIKFDRREVKELFHEYPFSKDGNMATDVMVRNQIN